MNGGPLDRLRQAVLRRDTARWIARMDGPQADTWREAYEAWRSRDPRRARAYDRQRALLDATMLAGVDAAPAAISPIVGPQRGRVWPTWAEWIAAGTLATAVAGAILVVLVESHSERPVVVTAGLERPRVERLSDGSRLLLDRGAVVEIAFTNRIRALTLTAGRVRVEAVRDSGRPLRLRAGPADLRTGNARFQVALGEGNSSARVIVLAGRVRLAHYPSNDQAGPALMLGPGEAARVGPDQSDMKPQTAYPADLDWGTGMISFRAAPLRDVVAAANQVSFTPIRIASQDISDMKVTGAYRAGDNGGLAQALAAGFGLSLRVLPDGAFLLAK